MEQDLPFTLELRIDWSEQDIYGHINNVMYNKYVQAARVKVWEAIGLHAHYIQTRIGPTLAATSIQFKAPLFYPGTIQICSGIIHIGKTSFRIAHRIYNHEKQLAATAEDVVVIIHYDTNEKIDLSGFIENGYQQAKMSLLK